MTKYRIRHALLSGVSEFFRTLGSAPSPSDSPEPEYTTIEVTQPDLIPPEIHRVRVEDVEPDDILVETWAGSASYDQFPLRAGLVIFIHVTAIADTEMGVEIYHSQWTHNVLPDPPDAGAVSATAHEGISIYPKGTHVTVLRGVHSIPVADMTRSEWNGEFVGPS
jgi:hypothetical protein